MATGQYDPNVLTPVTSNITVGTTAVALKSSSSLMAKFTISNPNASNAIYVGDSNVASSRFTVKITAGSSFTFGETKMVQNQTANYDLGRFFAVATAATQVATLTLYTRGTSGSTF